MKNKIKIMIKKLDKLEKHIAYKTPIIVLGIIVIIILFFTTKTIMYDSPYEGKYYNYHTDINLIVSTVRLQEAELVTNDASIVVKFKIDNTVIPQDSNGDKVYVRILDNKKKELYGAYLREGINEVKINYKKVEYDNTIGWVIEYYTISDERELSVKEPIEASVIYKEDLYKIVDLKDFFVKDLTDEQKDEKINYIRKRYLSDEIIEKVFPNKVKEIKKIFSSKEPYESLYNIGLKLKEKIKVEKEMMIETGIKEKEIQNIIKKNEDIRVKIQELKDLKKSGEMKLKKELDELEYRLSQKGIKDSEIKKLNELPDIEQKKEMQKILESK